MPTTAWKSYTGHRLQPLWAPDSQYSMPVQIAANKVLAAGTILAELAATPGVYTAYGSKQLAVPSAPTVTNGAAGSPGWPATATNVYLTYSTADGGETTPSLATAFTPTAGDKIHIADVTLPYGATGLNVYVGASATTATLVGSSATGANADYDQPATPGRLAPTVNTGNITGALTPPSAAPTLTDSSGAGAVPAGSYVGVITYLTAGGETTPSPAGHYTSAGTKKIHVAAVTLPAGATGMNFYAALEGNRLELWGTSTDGSAADYDLPTTAGAAPPTVNTATVTDGSQTARVILADDVVTDANGLVTFSNVSGTAPEFGAGSLTAMAYYRGTFSTVELVGLDANAVTQLGRLIEGTLSAGVLEVF